MLLHRKVMFMEKLNIIKTNFRALHGNCNTDEKKNLKKEGKTFLQNRNLSFKLLV